MTSTYNIFKELNDWQKDLTNHFNGNVKRYSRPGVYPLTNIIENEDDFIINALIPGIDPKDVDITYENNLLTIAGEKKNDVDQDQQYLRRERPFGKFHRTLKVRVPIDPDKTKANYNNGVLEITLKKAEAAKPVKINIA